MHLIGDDTKNELLSWLSRTCETVNRRTKQSNCSSNLNVKQFNSNMRKNSFSVRVINPWNSLPDYIKESKSLNIFKNSYDDHVKNVKFKNRFLLPKMVSKRNQNNITIIYLHSTVYER